MLWGSINGISSQREEYYEVDKASLEGFIQAQQGREKTLEQTGQENQQLKVQIQRAHELLRLVGQGNTKVIS